MLKCSLCNAEIISEEPAILTVGAYGTPKYLCECCASAIDDMTTSHDIDDISSAFDRIGTVIANAPSSDGTVNRVITEILERSRVRAERIKDGTYDFAEDEEDEEIPDEIPEELLETEEDEKEDEARIAFDRKLNIFTNIAVAVAFAALAVFAVVKFLL